MLLKKYVKSRRKLKILLLLMVIVLIVITLAVLRSTQHNGGRAERLLDERFIARAYGSNGKFDQPPLLQSPYENGVIVPEKYDEHKIKTRIIEDKIKNLKQRQQQGQNGGAGAGTGGGMDEEQHGAALNVVTTGVHIFYSAPVQWYKTKKSHHQPAAKELLPNDDVEDAAGDSDNDNTFVNIQQQSLQVPTTPKSVRIINTAFYPALGLYKPTDHLLQRHFENIRNCGIGVLILTLLGRLGEVELYNQILDLAPIYNLSVTFEISVAGNQSVEFMRQQLSIIKKFSKSDGFYRVYSRSRGSLVPLLYVSNAYKLSDTVGRVLCHSHPDNLRHTLDAYYIGHIRLKNHAETMRRLCFEGYYSKLPSNGATFASTWKNWSYLKSFALTYKMLFVPTVGPGFAERNKFPRHGDIQRHRSNGRYYGVAWRTAILNHVGFINIASYNNWPDGSQIEEVVPKAGFLDYNPGAKTKYLELTTHWVGNFLKTRQGAVAAAIAVGVAGTGGQNCYELLNNTIC